MSSCRSRLDAVSYHIDGRTLDEAKPINLLNAADQERVLRLADVEYYRLIIPSGERAVFAAGFMIVYYNQGLIPRHYERSMYMYTHIVTAGALAEHLTTYVRAGSRDHLAPYYHPGEWILDGSTKDMSLLWDWWYASLPTLSLPILVSDVHGHSICSLSVLGTSKYSPAISDFRWNRSGYTTPNCAVCVCPRSCGT
jgi:hypothetical protein